MYVCMLRAVRFAKNYYSGTLLSVSGLCNAPALPHCVLLWHIVNLLRSIYRVSRVKGQTRHFVSFVFAVHPSRKMHFSTSLLLSLPAAAPIEPYNTECSLNTRVDQLNCLTEIDRLLLTAPVIDRRKLFTCRSFMYVITCVSRDYVYIYMYLHGEGKKRQRRERN